MLNVSQQEKSVHPDVSDRGHSSISSSGFLLHPSRTGNRGWPDITLPLLPPTSPTLVLVSRMRSGPAAVVLSGAFCLDVGWLLYLCRPTYHLPRKAFCQPPKSRGRCHCRRQDGSFKPLPIGKRPPASDQFHFPENISKSSVRPPRTLPPAS